MLLWKVIEEELSNKASQLSSLKMGWPEITLRQEAKHTRMNGLKMVLLVMLENCFKSLFSKFLKIKNLLEFPNHRFEPIITLDTYHKLDKMTLHSIPFRKLLCIDKRFVLKKTLWNETNFLFVWSTVFVEEQ